MYLLISSLTASVFIAGTDGGVTGSCFSSDGERFAITAVVGTEVEGLGVVTGRDKVTGAGGVEGSSSLRLPLRRGLGGLDKRRAAAPR